MSDLNSDYFIGNETAAASAEIDGFQTLDIKPPPVPHWCFDFIIFYRSFDDEQSKQVVSDLEDYSKFSFAVNGVVSTLLAIFGLIGNFLLVHQIYHTRYFSRRLACHLVMLCCWDMALLFSCLFTYGISCLYYGIIPFVGIVAYLLYFFQPFASFCITGTIWQVLAITVERYMAVSRPLEQRTRNAQFSVRAICVGIVVFAAFLNMTPMIFEHELTDCYEMMPNHDYKIRTMIIPKPVIYVQYYAILVHLVPDIIFRAPTPIILIAILTVRTLQICSNRTIGMQTIHARRNVPYMLTILNIKFILCNTLYMFNTILMEVLGYGGKVSSTQTELEIKQYLQSLYLTDFSNMLLAIHSATNWLIFYHWPSLTKTKKYSNLTLTSHNNSKTQIIDPESAELLLSRFSANKRRICTEMLSTLCMDAPHIASLCVGMDYSQCKTKEHFAQHIKIQKHGAQLADIIEGVLLSLTNKNSSTAEIREHCRSIGYQHYEINLHCSAQNFKLVRDVLVYAITQSNYPKWHGSKVYQSGTANLQKTFIKVFNFALREMKSGALCAVVDASHPHLRQKSVDRTSSSKIYDKVNTVHISKKPNGILRTCESLSFMFPRAPSVDLATPTTTSTSPPGSRDSRMPHATGKSHSLDTEDHTFRNGFLAQPNAVSIYDLDQLKFTDCCNGKTYAI